MDFLSHPINGSPISYGTSDSTSVRMAVPADPYVDEVKLDPSEVLPLFISANVSAIESISSVSQTFKIEMIMTVTVRGSDSSISGMKEFLAKYDPKLDVLNKVECEIKLEDKRFFPDTGNTMYLYRVKGEFSEQCELQGFPFDHQELKIRFTMSGYVCQRYEDDVGKVDLNNPFFSKNLGLPDPFKAILLAEDDRKQSVIQKGAFKEPDVWNLSPNVRLHQFLSHPENSGSFKQYTNIDFVMKMRRKPQPYIYDIMIPIGVISTLTWGCSAIPHEEYADRSSVTLTLLLTSVAYKFVVSQNILRVAYLTLLDQYVLIATMFILLIVIENYIAFWLDSFWYDELMLSILFGVWVCTNVWFWVIARAACRKGITEEVTPGTPWKFTEQARVEKDAPFNILDITINK